MRINNQANGMRHSQRPGQHRDLAKFHQVLKDARADGEVTAEEKQGIKEAFSKLEPGEKAAVKHGRKHLDARKFKQEVKAALADGKITGEEKEQLKASFGKLEPGEQHRAIHALAQHGHQRLAMALGQG